MERQELAAAGDSQASLQLLAMPVHAVTVTINVLTSPGADVLHVCLATQHAGHM
jgi:hypothetical protein